MKDTLHEIAGQPRSVIKLIHKITWSLHQGREDISVLELSQKEKDWLKAHGFEYSYNRKIHEYQIILD